MCRDFCVELVLNKGYSLSVVCLDLCKKAKDDGKEAKVNLGWVSARIGDCLGHALFPVVARGVLLCDVLSNRRWARDGVASFSFE